LMIHGTCQSCSIAPKVQSRHEAKRIVEMKRSASSKPV
jgi:hypothetical protein